MFQELSVYLCVLAVACFSMCVHVSRSERVSACACSLESLVCMFQHVCAHIKAEYVSALMIYLRVSRAAGVPACVCLYRQLSWCLHLLPASRVEHVSVFVCQYWGPSVHLHVLACILICQCVLGASYVSAYWVLDVKQNAWANIEGWVSICMSWYLWRSCMCWQYQELSVYCVCLHVSREGYAIACVCTLAWASLWWPVSKSDCVSACIGVYQSSVDISVCCHILRTEHVCTGVCVYWGLCVYLHVSACVEGWELLQL